MRNIRRIKKPAILFCLFLLIFLIPQAAFAGNVDDGHCVVGAPKDSTTWYFAEGCTRNGFNTYLCLGNPNVQGANVQITFYRGDGATVSRLVPVSGNSRTTLLVNDENAGIGFRDDVSGDVSIKVEDRKSVV